MRQQLLLVVDRDDELDADEQHDADDHDEEAQDEAGLLALGATSAERRTGVALTPTVRCAATLRS